MPAVSRKQQRFFGMVRAAQKGELGQASPEVSRVAADISKKDAKDFASTKHKGLPEKKMKKEDYKYPLYAPYTKVDEFHANKRPLDEEDYDRMKDRRMERGGVGGNQRPNFAPGPKKSGKKYDGMGALDFVKNQIRAKHGKGAIIDTKKEEYVAEKKDCVKKEKKTMHNCAKKVCSEQWGVGECIYGQHAVPDADGNVAWYDVMFEHGIEKGVDVSTLEVLEEGSHGEHVEHQGEMVEAKVDTYKKLDDEGKEDARNLRKFGTSHNQHKHAVLRRALHRSRRGDKKVKGEKPVEESVEHIEEKKKGLWDNIHAKRKRGEKPAKPGDKDYPKTLNVEGYDKPDEKLKTDRNMFSIPKKDQDDAKARLLAKAKAKRAKLKEETINERGDFWHPDPEKDKKLGGPGANQRAREDRASSSSPAKKEDPKKLRKGESYMDYSKRQKASKKPRYSPELQKRIDAAKARKKEGIVGKVLRKVGLKKEEFQINEGEKRTPYAKMNDKIKKLHDDGSKKSMDRAKKIGTAMYGNAALSVARREDWQKTYKEFIAEGNRTGRMMHKSKTQVTGHISADRGSDEKKNREKRKGLEKDLKKHGIGHKKGVGEYKYDSGETGREVSYQTSKPDKMSKRRFGKVMRRLGRKHGQESVITKDKDKPAKLHYTEKGSKAKSDSIGKTKAGKHPDSYGETSGTKVRSGKLPKKTNKGAYHYG